MCIDTPLLSIIIWTLKWIKAFFFFFYIGQTIRIYRLLVTYMYVCNTNWEYNMCFLFGIIVFYADELSYKITLIILVILLFLKQTFLCAFL